MLKKFEQRAVPYLEFQPANRFDWLALAQHHGLPTRLLDWTLTERCMEKLRTWLG